jgi:hypothetical protein
MKKYEYIVDVCWNCRKLKGSSDLYFCSGCGDGKEGLEDGAWKEITLVEKTFN